MFRGAVLLVALSTGWLAASVPPPEPVTTVYLIPKLEGTTWAGDGVVAPTTYLFDKAGVLQYSYNGTTYRNGTWKQEGDGIYWESNQKYCEFQGKLEGDMIAGRAWNVRGGKWTLRFKVKEAK